MPHATMPGTGFQAIILCGPGESLNPFNSNPKDFPKALVPIANRPAVWYPLEWCYRMGVTNIDLVTPHESRSAIEAALSQNPHLTSLPSPRPTVVAPERLSLTTGTAEIFRFREVQDAISGDFIVLPCDIVCELNGLTLLEAWMTLQGGLGSNTGLDSRIHFVPESAGRRGGLGVWYQTKDTDESGVGVKKEETDFVALTDLPSPSVPPVNGALRPYLHNVAIAMPKAALQDEMEEKQNFLMRHALLRKYGRVKMKMTYRDAHIYFFPYWVKEIMRRNETFESVSEDVIGMWAKAGWQDGLAEKLGYREVFEQDRSSEKLGQEESKTEIDIARLSSTFDGFSAAIVDQRREKTDSSTFASRVHNAPPSPSVKEGHIIVPPILSYTHPAQPSAALLRRIDTVPLLLSVSLALAKIPSVAEAHGMSIKASPFAHAHKVPPTTTMPQQVTIQQPSVLIDANVTLTSKSTIRDSVIGANCILGTPGVNGAGVRLNRCLLMEGASIESGSALSGCVLGRRCNIGADCDLRDCYIQEGYIVPRGTTARGEVFAGFDEGGEDGEEGFASQQHIEANDADILEDGGI